MTTAAGRYAGGRDPESPPSVIYYTLDGRAGKMTLPDSCFILKRNFVENLLPQVRDKNAAAKIDENSTVTQNYCLLTYGSTSYWAPAGIVGVPRNKLLCLQKQAKVATNWLHLLTANAAGSRAGFYKRCPSSASTI